MKPITDIESARSLPERPFFTFVKEFLPNGDYLMIPTLNNLVSVELEDDAIQEFEDIDGRWMEVNYDSEGAYKSEVTR